MDRLYKFIADARAVPFLLQGLIKVTPPAELNDPSELTSNVIRDEVLKSRDRLRRDGYSEEDLLNLRCQERLFQQLAPQFQAVTVPATPAEATALIWSSFYDKVSTLERLLNATVLEMSTKVGIFCVSRRYDSLPMWAHYASNAAGLAVEFVGLQNVFCGDDTQVLSQPIPVKYDRDRVSVTFETKSHHSLFFSKFPDWSYEKEVRIVLPLTSCRRQTAGEQDIYLREIPRACISRVIFGWKMPNHVRRDIQVHVEQLNSEVEIVDARFAHGRIELTTPPQ